MCTVKTPSGKNGISMIEGQEGDVVSTAREEGALTTGREAASYPQMNTHAS